VIAHDLHPDYASTRYAESRAADLRIGVQHHVAHVLAAVAEHGITEPVLGLAFDGSGWGPDGTSWGGEFLIVDGADWTRLATFRPVPLPGGEQAIRDVWRVAFAAIHDAFGGDEGRALARRLPVLAAIPGSTLATVARMLETRVATIGARGIGRWFDAIGALVLGLPRAGFDGHVAIALEEAAVPAEGVPGYPVDLSAGVVGPGAPTLEIDLRPTVRALVSELMSGVVPGVVAARFHQTVVDASASVAAGILDATGIETVVLAGGSFQNRILERGLAARLGSARVVTAREVPVNDGGLALGQAWGAVLALAAGAGRG
jgi:hydrogenase maturation protein HypF